MNSLQNVSRDLPAGAEERKACPITTGVLDYFPLAVAEIARISKAGNDQHNSGQPLHWDRSKSTDHSDCITRHLIQRGTLDSDGQRHTGKVAWRALALLQEEIEAEVGFSATAEAFPETALAVKSISEQEMVIDTLPETSAGIHHTREVFDFAPTAFSRVYAKIFGGTLGNRKEL